MGLSTSKLGEDHSGNLVLIFHIGQTIINTYEIPSFGGMNIHFTNDFLTVGLKGVAFDAFPGLGKHGVNC